MQYVRLGKSGMKISRIVLGCMSYGYKEWGPWILDEAEGIAHIKAAYNLGINAFDTANSCSNGESERILGKAIKQHNLPRDEIVVMTKVYNVVGRTKDPLWFLSPEVVEKDRYINQRGLSRKVRTFHFRFVFWVLYVMLLLPYSTYLNPSSTLWSDFSLTTSIFSNVSPPSCNGAHFP